MKKLVIYFAILLGVLFGMEAINTAVLLHFHELPFYYTWNGFWRAALVVIIEAAILYYPVEWFVDKRLLAAWRELFEKNES